MASVESLECQISHKWVRKYKYFNYDGLAKVIIKGFFSSIKGTDMDLTVSPMTTRNWKILHHNEFESVMEYDKSHSRAEILVTKWRRVFDSLSNLQKETSSTCRVSELKLLLQSVKDALSDIIIIGEHERYDINNRNFLLKLFNKKFNKSSHRFSINVIISGRTAAVIRAVIDYRMDKLINMLM